MHVGTFSGVKSPGMVISSALGGTSKGNSSLTNDKIKDVFPTFLQKSQKNLLKHIFIHLVSQFDTILKNHSYLSPMSRIRTSLRLRMPMIYLAVIIKWRKNREKSRKKITDQISSSNLPIGKEKQDKCTAFSWLDKSVFGSIYFASDL